VTAAETQSIFHLDVNFTLIAITWCLAKSCEDGMLVTCLDLCAIYAKAPRDLRRLRPEALPKMKGGFRALYATLELSCDFPVGRRRSH
jgi:hypothetical protein